MFKKLGFHKKSLIVFGIFCLSFLLTPLMRVTTGQDKYAETNSTEFANNASADEKQKELSPDDADYRFKPGEERLSLRGTSAYTKFKEKEGIPQYTGFAVDVYELQLGPWQRMGPGIEGAYIDLDGAGALVNAFLLEIPAGGKTISTHHLFEEQIVFLSGEGETHIWQSDPSNKAVIPWKTGTLFSPPLNAWHQHFNKGTEPARLATVTDLPLKIDLFRSADFLFNAEYDFTDRYAGQADYFDPENSQDYAPMSRSHSLSIVNLVRNVWTWRLFHAGQGYKDIDRHFLLSDNTMTGHVEQFPVGTYERAHRHGPSSTIVLLGGTGYSLMWDTKHGYTPWKNGKGDQVKKVDWHKGIMVIPPIQWFHQHFNNGAEPARFIKLGGSPGHELYPMTGNVLEGGQRYTVLFRNEDPYVRTYFLNELAKNNASIAMPPRDELIRMERASGEGPLTIP